MSFWLALRTCRSDLTKVICCIRVKQLPFNVTHPCSECCAEMLQICAWRPSSSIRLSIPMYCGVWEEARQKFGNACFRRTDCCVREVLRIKNEGNAIHANTFGEWHIAINWSRPWPLVQDALELASSISTFPFERNSDHFTSSWSEKY